MIIMNKYASVKSEIQALNLKFIEIYSEKYNLFLFLKDIEIL